MLSISSEAEAVKRHEFFAYHHIIFPSNEVPWPTTWQLFWRRFLRCCLEHPGMLGWLVDCTVQHASCRLLNVYYLMNWNDLQYELLVKLHSWWLLYSNSVSWLGKKSKNIQLDRWGLFPPAKLAPQPSDPWGPVPLPLAFVGHDGRGRRKVQRVRRSGHWQILREFLHVHRSQDVQVLHLDVLGSLSKNRLF